MKRSYILVSAMLMALGGSTLLHCSGDSSNNPDAGDASTDTKPTKDVVTTDSPTSDAGDGGGIVTPAGTELAASDGIQIFGVTTDGHVVYADTSTPGLYAVPVAGGTPVKIAAPSGSYVAGIAGSIVFVWESVTANSVGSLHLWKSGGTYATVLGASASAPNAGFAASVDGLHVIYNVNSNAGGTVGDFVGANSDGTSPTTLISQVDIGPANGQTFVNGCIPVIGFATNALAIASTCTTNPGDAGTPSANVQQFVIAGTTWTPTTIIPAALDTWSTDGDGTNATKVLTATGLVPAEAVYTLPAPSTPVPIDTKQIQNGDWTFAYMNRAGTTVFYQSAGGLYTSSATASSVGTVQATGVNFLRAISPDDNYFVYSTNFDNPPPNQFGSDLYVTKAMAGAAAPTTLVSNTKGALFGLRAADNFTADSKYVLFIENVNTTAGIGDFYAALLPSGTPAMIATGQWQNWSATGDKVVYEDNCPSCSATAGKGTATADIEVVDVSTTNAPTKIQASVDVPLTPGVNGLFLSPAKDRIIYAYSQNTPATSGAPPAGGNGLYSVAIP